MAQAAPLMLDDVERCVDAIIARVGQDIRIGLPLGLGKPVELVNALYARAKADPALQLTFLTALSLEQPEVPPGVEGAFLGPFLERVFAGVPQLDYAADLRRKALPPNVQVKEFFFRPGSQMGNAHAQQHYISTNYTFAARDVFNQGCNVAAQMIARREDAAGPGYSLSCNPDTGPELVALLREAEAAGRRRVAVVGVINQQLPFMARDAEVAPAMFDLVVDHPRYSSALFSTPKQPVASADYAIGLQASALIRDGGTLQVGIGALGDALVYAVQLRQQQNDAYRAALAALELPQRCGGLLEGCGGDTPFITGLYGATEMFVDGFMDLVKAGVLKREVYDFWALQQLVNDGLCDPRKLAPTVLDHMEALGLRVIRGADFEVLQHHGFFNDATRYEHGHLVTPGGQRIIANVADDAARRVMAEQCLGQSLRNGIVVHGGFFLGPRRFYDWLRDMSQEERDRFCMTGVYKVNQLDHNPRLYKAQRVNARFINTGIMVTLSGAVVSDGLENGKVISGVGGQYNFVAMAHQLPTGRSIIMIRAAREAEGGASSNVVFAYGHCTIPRHLRDIVVTEYGIADLRSQSDAEVAKRLICIADSRFQAGLLEQAVKAGKVEAGWQVPAEYRDNTPAALERRFKPQRAQGLFGAFPLGSDFTAEELKLAGALKQVKARAASTPKWKLLLGALRAGEPPASVQPYLARLKLEQPKTLQDRVVRMLLVEALTS
ncbi:acetyl-CoA hydrolase [Solimonas sp. K1W22B-7]|uniref:acetyl-CoA hydrolase/transferase C-terminal domain-containing protein n=1 Tax=Solimonas sp. K1W22B-7 TaxID=2303331 RepID=UPI000E33277E|nr:acetyl-CoA hydrolase/transferase C-terminal domain-containing protein [Solimonas sp. K1W22B-7]AXQ31247.1 acetyl-CoA hydrolase [Solimonas sp. K1W22B-7]